MKLKILLSIATFSGALAASFDAHAQACGCFSFSGGGQNSFGVVDIDNTRSSNPALYVTNSGFASYGVLVESTQGVASVFGNNTGGDGVRGDSSSSPNAGVSGVNHATTGSAFGVYGQSGNGFAVYAAGNLAYTGTLSHQSDARLKKNVMPIGGALDRVLKLRGVTYEWKDPQKHGGATSTQTGFIAQEVEKEFPGWVRVDTDGYKMLNTDGVDAMLLEGLRTVKAENDALRDRVKALESNRRPLTAGLGESALGIFGLLILGGAFLLSRRHRSAHSA
jgi:endosialidase-like protein